MNWRLYRLVIRNQAVLRRGRGLQRNTAQLSKLSGQSTSKAISLAPGEIRFEFLRAGEYAAKLAQEAKELFDAEGFETVPLYSMGSETETDGYYVLKSADGRPLDPATNRLHRIDGVLRAAGTRRSHLRSVATTIATQPNDFGNDERARVGVDARATRPQWKDRTSNATEDATIVTTRTGAFGDVALVDPQASTFEAPTLVYDLPYEHQGAMDVRVWDDRGHGLDGKTDSDGVVQWARVFTTSHEFAGATVLSNGLVRLRCADDAETIAAERYDAGAGAWTAVALGSSEWTLVDVGVVSIGPAAVDARLTFADRTSSPVAYYELAARVTRGDETIQFTTPGRDAQGGTPAGLLDLLDPIASTSRLTAGESLGLVARDDVRY
ncbi:hypothetical protein [Halobellus sp. H-GB7]|uniref:hypothetical protein n=1 Tax=Halobellus sp. H-GB7 TaxID=3069756 RepID=UPI0027B741A5|nr:hypothetical protein [Halobellus sp. H-GB7]MDQ2053228.1 hypothetical protein [Halobellus sp. H-GB7]